MASGFLLLTSPHTASRGTPRGLVRLARWAFADDRGPFLALGASLFWAVWAYQHDRRRLERNLEDLAAAGVDYIRAFGVVGGESWKDRAADPRSAGYDAAIAGVTDLAHEKGLRVQWTIFASSAGAATADARSNVVDRFIAMSRGRGEKILAFEVGNELYKNLGDDPATHEECKRYARRLRTETPHVVAVTAPNTFDASPWYGGSTANLLTMHLDRDTTGAGGLWRPVRQAREPMQMPGWSGAWASNEPIGPQSSVNRDDDPLRLTIAAAYTWLCKGAAYVYHAGAGIRGGDAAWEQRPERKALGIPVDLKDTSNFAATVAGFRAVRALLPADLPNWIWWNANRAAGAGHPFDAAVLQDATDRGEILRAFAAVDGPRFVVMPIAVTGRVAFIARRPLEFAVHDPLTGRVLEQRTVATGEPYHLGPLQAVILIGRYT